MPSSPSGNTAAQLRELAKQRPADAALLLRAGSELEALWRELNARHSASGTLMGDVDSPARRSERVPKIAHPRFPEPIEVPDSPIRGPRSQG